MALPAMPCAELEPQEVISVRNLKLLIGLVAVLLLLTAVPAFAQRSVFPDIIPLPDGWRPEGIATGYGTDFYVGSLADGAIFRGDLRTGEGDVWIEGEAGNVSVGLAFDARSGYLFVAGGPTGAARVYDTRTGELVASYQFADPPTFVNDAIVTGRAVYFTDSQRAVLYVLPLGPGGSVPAGFEVLPLSGDWQQVAGFNANGIEASPNGKYLIVVHSTLGFLYQVNPETGEAEQIDLGGQSVSAGDGLLLDGKSLYVVRNQLNQILEIRLSSDFLSGSVIDTIMNPAFDVPTTLAEHGNALYAVNARFSTTPTPETEYDVVRVRK